MNIYPEDRVYEAGEIRNRLGASALAVDKDILIPDRARYTPLTYHVFALEELAVDERDKYIKIAVAVAMEMLELLQIYEVDTLDGDEIKEFKALLGTHGGEAKDTNQ